MSITKDYIAGAIRQEIEELQQIIFTLEDNSHLDKDSNFDMGLSRIQSVESRLKKLRQSLKIQLYPN